MIALRDPCSAYLEVLEPSTRGIVRALRRATGLSRRDAAEVLATAAALLPGGLARHTRRRPREPWAAVEVVRHRGRPADLDAPELGVASRFETPRLSPRLAGLLGEAGPRAARWLADRIDADEETAGRALAAVAPVVLGALERALDGRDIAGWVARLPDDALTDPDRLLAAGGDLPEIHRRLRRRGRPLLTRLLGLEG